MATASIFSPSRAEFRRCASNSPSAVKVLMGAVGALLLLVCANIAGLMLARGEAARKEIAVRLSLGATRFTVASQLMMDAVVLSILGAAGAMLIARWGGHFCWPFFRPAGPSPSNLPPMRASWPSPPEPASSPRWR